MQSYTWSDDVKRGDAGQLRLVFVYSKLSHSGYTALPRTGLLLLAWWVTVTTLLPHLTFSCCTQTHAMTAGTQGITFDIVHKARCLPTDMQEALHVTIAGMFVVLPYSGWWDMVLPFSPAGMQWCPTSPCLSKSKLQAPTSKEVLTVFFDIEGPPASGLNLVTDKINANCYCHTFQQLYIRVKYKHLGKFTDGIILLHNSACTGVAHKFRTEHHAMGGAHASCIQPGLRSMEFWCWMMMCRRLWYAGLGRSARNSLQMGSINLCISRTPVWMPEVIFSVTIPSPVRILNSFVHPHICSFFGLNTYACLIIIMCDI